MRLDFQELYHYNFSNDPGDGNSRHPLDTTEAIRFINMELVVTDIQPPGEDDGQDLPVVYFTGTSSLQEASLDPTANMTSSIRGTVRLTKQGEVRWISYSVYWGWVSSFPLYVSALVCFSAKFPIYFDFKHCLFDDSEERWKSEGIQVGGVGSTRGVFGHWFDKFVAPVYFPILITLEPIFWHLSFRNLSIEGPVGPSAFWKVTNGVGEVPNGPGEYTDEDDDDDDEEGDMWRDNRDIVWTMATVISIALWRMHYETLRDFVGNLSSYRSPFLEIRHRAEPNWTYLC